jgi:membrane-associated phospholipid phosphatase
MILLPAARAWPQDGTDKPLMDEPSTNSSRVSSDPDASPAAVTRQAENTKPDDSARPGFVGHITDFAEDQKRLWTSPFRVRPSDATWLVPLGGITAGLFVTDRQYSASLPQSVTTLNHYKTVSDVGVASLVGAGAGLYLFSFTKHDEHWRETGFLAGEAALNSLVTVEALKYSFGRLRPYQDDGSGAFFRGGTSFPSEHAAAAWSIAGVIAHEYQGTLPKLFAYGMASAVSFSRIRARQHFPSDVLIGSVLGYLVSQSVYNRRHDAEIGGGSWASPREFVSETTGRKVAYMGSPYVALDSWVYPALERLAALGYLKTASLGIRPWTRLECARLLSEATDLVSGDGEMPEAQDIVQSLSQEFAKETDLEGGERNVSGQIESVYQRSLGIFGRPLTDGYHFGQTVLNDYGRPFQQGFNTVAGASSWAAMGPFVLYVRGEYQHAPSAPAPSQASLDFISNLDSLPANAPSIPVAATNQFRLLDAYVGMNLANWQISFGRQSLWWGPSEGGTLAFTNNAQPLEMFRLNRVSPFRLPWILGFFGDIRFDSFIGRLSGQEFINNSNTYGSGLLAQGQYGQNLNPQPFLSGGKISLKFTTNLEFSMSKTTIYGGPGNPLTLKTFVQSIFALSVKGEEMGDGRSMVDFSYRLPKLRNWLTLYVEGFSETEISPLTTPQRSVWQGGLYLSKLPRVHKIDLRFEGGFTSPVDFPSCNGCYYHNFQYLNGFTNNGQLMGTWIGRAAQGESIQSTYWLSSTKRIEIEARHRKVDSQFLPQGGTQNDVALKTDFLLKSGIQLSGTVQYENWLIPLLAPGAQTNVTAQFQLAYWPHLRWH